MSGPPALIETPTGDLALPFTAAATLLSLSAAFQAMVGAGDAAGALAFIDYPLRDVANYDFPVPGAILSDDEGLRQSRKRLPVVREGQLLLELFDEMSPTYYADG